MIVYKYLPTQYKEAFLRGKIWVNTYEGIRKSDLQTLIADSEEGKIISHIPSKMSIDPSNSQEKNMQYIEALKTQNIKVEEKILQIGGYIHIKGLKSNPNITLADAHMFCVTTKRDDLDWSEKEKYDSCIKILDFKEFTKRLSDTISESGKKQKIDFLFTYKNCSYNGHNIHYSNLNNLNNYFLKRSEYQKQEECRFIAIPITKIGTKIQIRTDVKITPQTYQIDKTGLFEDCETEIKECHTV